MFVFFKVPLGPCGYGGGIYFYLFFKYFVNLRDIIIFFFAYLVPLLGKGLTHITQNFLILCLLRSGTNPDRHARSDFPKQVPSV